MPLSTTHCMVGSLGGLILAQKIEVIKRLYEEEEEKEPAETVEQEPGIESDFYTKPGALNDSME